MEFIKYQSLVNHYREKTIDWIERQVSNEVMWTVSEKIDGANFAFYCNGYEVKMSSRKGFVDSKFYNCGSVFDEHRQNVLDLFNYLKASKGVDYIIVRGELCGAGIQNRVDYGDKKFVAFDLDFCTGTTVEHCTVSSLCALMRSFNIPFVYPLFMGSFKECLEYNNEFNSTILNKENNLCEGTVIRGYTEDVGDRIIIKNKSEAFSEVKAKKRGLPRPDIKYENIDSILGYININRVNALLSKLGGIGALSNEDFGNVIRMFSQDVITDLIADGVLPSEYKSKEAWSNFGKFIVRESKSILKEEILYKL